MTLAKDPRKLFILAAVILILIYAMLRIKQHAGEIYYQQKIEEYHPGIIYPI